MFDEKGHHLCCCKLGGNTVARHNLVRDAVGLALRALLSGVFWERVVPEIENTDPRSNGITKLDIVAETRHNTDVFGARAKLRRQLAKIDTEQRAYDRVAGGDEWNLLGRRIERTLYGSAMVEAHGAIETAMHAYKKEIGLVPIVHRLLKSLARRRVFLGHAALAALSGGRGLGHLCTVWMTTVSALDESIAAIRAGKDAAARKAPVQLIEGLRGAWTKVEGLADVNADTLD